MPLHSSRFLRRIVIPLLRWINPGDISIRHHWTGDRFRLHAYRHKGYWFYGRRREQSTMEFIRMHVRPGSTVLDVGAHIGYLSLYFARLVAPTGRVFAFEPGSNNLAYTRANVACAPHITLVEKGVGSRPGRLEFFTEDDTGQNNSFIANYLEQFPKDDVHCHRVDVRHETVEVITLDSFVEEHGIWPTFVKVDVEGFERDVLQGASAMLAHCRPTLLIELQLHRPEVLQLLADLGYCLQTPEGKPIRSEHDLDQDVMNICALPASPVSAAPASGSPAAAPAGT